MMSSVGIVSLGCAKNRVDAEMMMYQLNQAGFQLKEDPAMADAVIVNTCGFIESAKQESIDEILELAQLKKEGKIKAIIVTGCLAERYNTEIMKELEEVDAVIGIGKNADIADVVQKALDGEKTEVFPDKMELPMEGGRVQSTERHWAYLKIADGCDNCCTYCAIPLIRGSFRSRRMENIIEEAERLVRNGVKELNVIAQDTTRYGEDLYGELKLAELLRKLCKIDGLQWIRVLYCYPDRITDELLDTIREEEKIVKYIDLPLQHCNGRVLRAMNRRGDKESLLTLVSHIREKIPGVVLRTTLIAGFPGETEEDFEELSDFVAQTRFERLGCFAYSQEEDTPAALLPDQIDEDVKNRRAEIISEQEALIIDSWCEDQVGKELDVLVDGFDRYADCWFGRSLFDAPEVDPCVFFTVGETKPRPGDIVRVHITDHIDCDLTGEML
ncbi:30S ribosomal protein S12 methylthiotransferase RimO [uncultured Ruminococcus sp.]|uniref:30S ribosomal protein S12 methylthiotransferase RimO n=1 Tax=uncultured Ruminococcus sp. TaxID=165186 RepID=UPI00292E7AAB|nr:30S ribosomal protein S12 methylthiotransferase RimO [uncultured Ruminococcus sp.]